jgi:hypothetical protein
MKCLKATGGILISGGTILASSYEDALNSNGIVTITGGNLTLTPATTPSTTTET